MLRKLIKYDLKWIYKALIVFYVLSFVFSGIGRGLSCIKNSIVFSVATSISFSIAISMMISSIINCVMRLWVRFVRNAYKDEAYLTHTLPASKNKIYMSKVISAIITIFTTFLVIVLCLFICFYSKTNIEILKSLLEIAASTYDLTVIGLILLIFLVIFLEVLFVTLIGYTAIIIGNKSNSAKMLKAVISGIILYLITQAATLLFIYAFGLFNIEVMNLINTTNMVNVDAIKSVMFLGIGIYMVYIVVYYVIGKKLFERGVNVD